MDKVSVGVTRQRGEYEETPVYDMTRVSNPVMAKILRLGDDYLVVPENDLYPVVLRDTLDGAVAFIERIVS